MDDLIEAMAIAICEAYGDHWGEWYEHTEADFRRMASGVLTVVGDLDKAGIHFSDALCLDAAQAICREFGCDWDKQADFPFAIGSGDPQLPAKQSFGEMAGAALNVLRGYLVATGSVVMNDFRDDLAKMGSGGVADDIGQTRPGEIQRSYFSLFW